MSRAQDFKDFKDLGFRASGDAVPTTGRNSPNREDMRERKPEALNLNFENLSPTSLSGFRVF